MTVMLNVPDPKYFGANILLTRKRTKSRSFNLVYHGTVTARLGVDLILKALAILVDKIPEIKFHIWSKSGDQMDDIEQLSKILG